MSPQPFQSSLKLMILALSLIATVLALVADVGVGGLWALLLAGAVLAAYWGTRRNHWAWFVLGVAGILAAVALTLGLAGTQPAAREGPRLPKCENNVRTIVLALVQYHDSHGTFPPACIADSNGKPMHSWRVLILPYLDQRELYQQYRFDEPWDGPHNRMLHDLSLKIFQCPSHNKSQINTETNYVAVVGPGTVWPGGKNDFVRMADLRDGASNTVLLVEVANSGIHWMEPRDLHVSQMAPVINPPRGRGISSNHKGGANVGFADGSVRFLKSETSAETIHAMLTRSGGEPPPLEPKP